MHRAETVAPFFWIVRDDAGARSIFLQAASAPIFAMLHSAIAGHRGREADIHTLDANTAPLSAFRFTADNRRMRISVRLGH